MQREAHTAVLIKYLASNHSSILFMWQPTSDWLNKSFTWEGSYAGILLYKWTFCLKPLANLNENLPKANASFVQLPCHIQMLHFFLDHSCISRYFINNNLNNVQSDWNTLMLDLLISTNCFISKKKNGECMMSQASAWDSINYITTINNDKTTIITMIIKIIITKVILL